MTRIFKTRVTGRACENFGAVDYTITDTITEKDGGLEVVTVSRGIYEGERVDEKSVKWWASSDLGRAAAYRLSNGWVEVKS